MKTYTQEPGEEIKLNAKLYPIKIWPTFANI